ncbi:MAG: hypothetical protein Tsb002_35970 [Wenzhouxiangellaceae bacterium]
MQRLVCGLLLLLPAFSHAGSEWTFADMTSDLGVSWQHFLEFGPFSTPDYMTGGLAAADIDNDGWVDLYIPQGDLFNGRLLRNLGNGQFTDVASAWTLEVNRGPNESSYATGAAFADLTGNGFPDLLLGGIRGFGLRLYLNDGTAFTEQTTAWGLAGALQHHISASFADVNGDQRLDVALGHWDNSQPSGSIGHLWLNLGDGLNLAGDDWGISAAFSSGDYSFTPNFADFNHDGWPDLVVSSDFGTSQTFLNQQGLSLSNTTTAVISDENGMGGAVGDYDNDGDLDWFVSAIWDATPDVPWGSSGNRLYRNDGNGVFSDVTDAAGVRQGEWGWGACMMDFNNDGHLDIFHVNGWNTPGSPFQNDPSRLFVNQGNGQFVEQAMLRGIADSAQGRGVVCFDYDRDGDIDVFIQNNQGIGSAYRNNASSNGNHWLGLILNAPLPNRSAIGARVQLVSASGVQTREMQIPNHYASTSPAELLFGLGNDAVVSELRIEWPDGQHSRVIYTAPDQWLTLDHPDLDHLWGDDFE